jgi:hypothetical protein
MGWVLNEKSIKKTITGQNLFEEQAAPLGASSIWAG